MVTQVVLNNLTLVAMGMCGLFQSCYSFQNAHQTSDFRLLRSFEPDATMEPRYLKSDTWLDLHRLEGLPVGCNSQAHSLWCTDDKVKVSSCFCCSGKLGLCLWAWGFKQGDVICKVQIINDLAECRLERQGWVTTPESSCDVAVFSK